MGNDRVSLSIKDVPTELAARLRERAARHHRSLQRELMAIVEAAVAPPATMSATALRTAETEPRPMYGAQPVAAGNAQPAAPGSLLAELDVIVAGSRWGHAPVLTREQANDRRLAREIEFDARRAGVAADPASRT